MYIDSGDKNSNIHKIVTDSKNVIKATNDGVDDYVSKEGFFIPKRDPRELNVIKIIRGGCPKPADPDPIPAVLVNKMLATVLEDVSALKHDTFVQKLLDVLANGGEIVLEDGADFGTAVVIDNDVTLDLNGKSLTVSEDVVGDGVFHVTNGTLTINGKGCINGVGKNDYNMAIWADGGNVVINDGTFTNEGAVATDDPGHMDLIYTKNGGKVEINGGLFRCVTPKWTLNKHDSTESSIIVKGGTFVNYNPAETSTEMDETSFVAEGYVVTSETKNNGEVWYTVVPA